MTIKLRMRTRLTLTYTAVVSVLLAVLGFTLYVALNVQLNEAADVDLRSRANGIVRFLERHNEPDRIGGLPDELREHADFNSRNDLSQIGDTQGQWIYRSPGIEALTLPEMKGTVYANVRGGRRSFRVLHREIDLSQRHYTLDVAVDRSEYVEALEGLGSLLLLGLPTSLLLAFLVGLWMSARALRPIQQIADTVREIDDRRLTVRLPLAGTGDELDGLSKTLNSMLDRLQHAFERISRFTADASHELRTPLALIRGNAEMMRAESSLPQRADARAIDILAEADRMQTLIQSLLELARCDDATSGAFEMIDPADLTARASEVGRHLADDKSVRFSVKVPKSIFPVRGNDLALSRVLVILLDNAMRHTAAGGEVSLEVRSSAKECRMEIRDTGCGIDAADLPNIFDRFYRADTSRNRATGGAGLGLSIAREIVTAHGGTIHVESAVEHGSAFTVSIPSQTT
jgi:two-component system heavy metal sensor histidine kinase CusS